MGKKVKILRETMKIAQAGSYFSEDREIFLPYDFDQIRETRLYSPEQIRGLLEEVPVKKGTEKKTRAKLYNQDTLEAAYMLNRKRKKGEKPVLILNFANPHRPGGGIRAIPRTQEEHLCVKTTVLTSLEDAAAWPFYQSNLDCGTQAQTDAVLFSPNTVVIRNPDLTLREDPFPVSVMTVSAPIASRMEAEELPDLPQILERRIRGMLHAAIAEGYEKIVLGAWGCGNFGNDPALVAKLFYQALYKPFQADGKDRLADRFTNIAMAVLDTSQEQHCYKSFRKYFREGRHVAFFRQHSNETCGISCVLMLLDLYGKVRYPTPKQEKKLYDLYRSQAFKGVTAAAAADCLSRNGFTVELIHSSENLMDNKGDYFPPKLYADLLDEYKIRLQGCQSRISVQTGVEFTCENIKNFLKNGKQIMLQCIVSGDADGMHDRVLHWILLYGYEEGAFLACDPSSFKRRFGDEELAEYMDTPIGKICVVVGGSP